MAEAVSCPVPPEQRPLEEFQQLSTSWFFSWPVGDEPFLARSLAISWIMVLPVCLLVASGSWALKQDPPRLNCCWRRVGSCSPFVFADAAMAGLDLRDETFAERIS